MPGELIAIVDHEPVILELMAEILIGEGYRPAPWCGAAGALEMIQRKQPSLVILDAWIECHGPGWALLRRLKQNPATCHIPVVLCATDERLLKAQHPSVERSRYVPLCKPFELADFLVAVRGALTLSGKECA